MALHIGQYGVAPKTFTYRTVLGRAQDVKLRRPQDVIFQRPTDVGRRRPQYVGSGNPLVLQRGPYGDIHRKSFGTLSGCPFDVIVLSGHSFELLLVYLLKSNS